LAQALALELIDRSLFFKLSKIVQSVTSEELNYLSKNIKRNENIGDIFMLSLSQHGLVSVHSYNPTLGTFNGQGEWKTDYNFTVLAECIDRFAIRFRDGTYSYSGLITLADLSWDKFRTSKPEPTKSQMTPNNKDIDENIPRIISADQLKFVGEVSF